MLKIVISIYQELYSTRFKVSNRENFELEFFAGSFLMGAKHKFYLDRLGSVSSSCFVFFELRFPHSNRSPTDQI